jgi:hypothetical protein
VTPFTQSVSSEKRNIPGNPKRVHRTQNGRFTR